MSLYVFEVRDDELLGSIARQAKEAGITRAAIVSLIGAADSFTISTMPAGRPADDVIETIEGLPAELHGSGEIVEGDVHVHATMAVDGHRAIAGHLHAAQIGHWFARAYVLPVDETA